MINGRYAMPVALLLALAIVPTALHVYWGPKTADGLTVNAIPATLDGHGSEPTARRQDWVDHNFKCEEWIERRYAADGDDVTLFVGRSYDAKRLYHHPELALLRGTETTPAGVQRVPARPDVPLYLVRTSRDGRNGIAVYALLYDGRFVQNPVRFQLAGAARQVFSKPRTMTLFMASDLSGSIEALDRAPATRLLLAALRAFEQQPVAVAQEE